MTAYWHLVMLYKAPLGQVTACHYIHCNAAPRDAHLGVPISLQGLPLSYDHHVCHPRNGERLGEEGKSRAARTWAREKILIERSEEFVCQLPCRNNTPFLRPAISLLNAQAAAHTHSSIRSTRPLLPPLLLTQLSQK